MLNYNLC